MRCSTSGPASPACSKASPTGRYISDIHIGELQDVTVRAFRVLLSIFVRGRVHLHFDSPDEVVEKLRDAGFASAKVRLAAELAGEVAVELRQPAGSYPRSMDMIKTTLYSDPACPWAYSESPALRVIEWRYGEQLDWRLVLIGLTEDASQYEQRGYTPLRGAISQAMFRRRYGMPFSPAPEGAPERAPHAPAEPSWRRGSISPAASGVCSGPCSWPTSPRRCVLDDDAQLAEALDRAEGIDGHALVARIDDPDVVEAYEQDKAETRSAAGSAAELQGKTRVTDGPVRFTAPSVTFQVNGTRLVAGGFQPVEAYDILIANLAPGADPAAAARRIPSRCLSRFPDGLSTQEVAALMTEGNDAPDRAGGRGGPARARRRGARRPRAAGRRRAVEAGGLR